MLSKSLSRDLANNPSLRLKIYSYAISPLLSEDTRMRKGMTVKSNSLSQGTRRPHCQDGGPHGR